MKIKEALYPGWNRQRDTHLYIQPHTLLRPYIAHYTYMQDALFQQTSLILVPDASGCLVLSDVGNGLSCSIWGPTTKSALVHADATRMRFRFFVEFQPTGAHALLHHDQHVIQDVVIQLAHLDPKLSQALSYAYETCEYLDQFVTSLDQLFLKNIVQETSDIRYIQQQIRKGNHQVKEICDNVGYSTRHIQRLFQAQIGCSMKTYQRIERINQAIKLIQQRKLAMSQIAQLCGYYDESHFIRDFQLVTATTPKRYLQQMSDFYNELYKY